jgi:fused signal recognition particle receptor
MPLSHEQLVEILFGLGAFLFTAIVVGIMLKFFQIARKEKQAEISQVSQAPTPTPAAPEVSLPKPVEAEVEVNLKEALKKTEENLFGRIRALFKTEASGQHLDEIEEILYTSDLGPLTVQRLMGALQEKLSKAERADYETIRETLKTEIKNIFAGSEKVFSAEGILEKICFAPSGPTVLMIVGVNGAGKTTSIGKISAQLAKQGKKVLVAAGDTFRAAAGGQLKVWTDRAHVEIFSPEGVTDPSAVAYDALAKAKAQSYDVLIVDTAGRLHTQAHLMEEIKKIKRVMAKVIPESPHETLIVLDANSGQNALMQAREFHKALGLTGAILTKMDGTAKGGVAVGLAQELQIPIKLIGVGERIQDLRAFSAQEFVDSIFQ